MISGNDIIIKCNEGVRTIRPPTKITGAPAIRETSVPAPGSLSTASVSSPGLILINVCCVLIGLKFSQFTTLSRQLAETFWLYHWPVI